MVEYSLDSQGDGQEFHPKSGFARMGIRKVGSGQFLPPLPHNRFGPRSELDCGGEGWGEGATSPTIAPSPRPSPHSQVLTESRVASGERGQKTRAAHFSDAHTFRTSVPSSQLGIANPLRSVS